MATSKASGKPADRMEREARERAVSAYGLTAREMATAARRVIRERDVAVAEVARAHGIETLAERRSDSLDFHELAVWTVEEMLRKAYEAGRASVKG